MINPKRYDWCGVCGEELDLQRDELYRCFDCGDFRSLCVGCAYECAPCGATRCKEHIVEAAIAGEGRFSEYACSECDRQAKAELAKAELIAKEAA